MSTQPKENMPSPAKKQSTDAIW
jgi:hypothetical protein